MLVQSFTRGSTHLPLIEQTLGDVFDEVVERWPHREAVVSRHEGRRYTYRELQLETNRLASALLNLGLTAGDRVGIWSHNYISWLLMQLATAKTGIILVNVNLAYRAAELEYALSKSGCKAKGATLTHRNILNNGFFVGERMRLTHEDKLCIPVPLYHCFGMVMGNLGCLTHGSTIVYPNVASIP